MYTRVVSGAVSIKNSSRLVGAPIVDHVEMAEGWQPRRYICDGHV